MRSLLVASSVVLVFASSARAEDDSRYDAIIGGIWVWSNSSNNKNYGFRSTCYDLLKLDLTKAAAHLERFPSWVNRPGIPKFGLI